MTNDETVASALVPLNGGDQSVQDVGSSKRTELATALDLHFVASGGHAGAVRSVALSGDGERLASGSWDKTVKLWDARTGRLLHTLTGHENWVTSVALSGDGERLASGSNDKTVKLWDARTGRLLHTLAGHKDRVSSVALSGEGERLASGSYDDTVKLWDARTGKLIHSFEGHLNWVSSVCLSPDGKTIISGSADGTIKFWSIEHRRLLATILNGAPGEWLTYTPEGYFTGTDGMVQHTLRQFQRGETKFAEEILKLENPNARKVAEALQGIVRTASTTPMPSARITGAPPLPQLSGDGKSSSNQPNLPK